MTNEEMDEITDRYLLRDEGDLNALPEGAEDELAAFFETLLEKPDASEDPRAGPP
jgi:hypothetical protein